MLQKKSKLNDREILDKIFALLEGGDRSQTPKFRIYNNKQVMELLHIKDEYLKKLRDNGFLGYYVIATSIGTLKRTLTASSVDSTSMTSQSQRGFPTPICTYDEISIRDKNIVRQEITLLSYYFLLCSNYRSYLLIRSISTFTLSSNLLNGRLDVSKIKFLCIDS